MIPYKAIALECEAIARKLRRSKFNPLALEAEILRLRLDWIEANWPKKIVPHTKDAVNEWFVRRKSHAA